MKPVPPSSTTILDRFPTSIGLGLRPAYLELLHKLGDPQHHLPPVFHVAGTNGKGSTCAFLRAMLEAAGHRVHVYTSPHLVRFHERIRVAGDLIAEDSFVEILQECASHTTTQDVTIFEILTAAALTAFARTPADFTILEVGLGGRLDATNVVDRPLTSLIARLSYDHQQHLGTSLTAIAREKAGIMRRGVPCFAAPQPEAEALTALRAAAADIGAPLAIGGADWRVEPHTGGFRYVDSTRAYDLPTPALLGAHQYWNAGLAIASLAALPQPLPESALATGMRNVTWPARLQRLSDGALSGRLPNGWELWLDGGHNDSAGDALAQQAKNWRKDGRDLHLICGMLTTKNPRDFLRPLAAFVTDLHTIPIPDEPLSFTADTLAATARDVGLAATAHATLEQALNQIIQTSPSAQPARILICGSLYLAGYVLAAEEINP